MLNYKPVSPSSPQITRTARPKWRSRRTPVYWLSAEWILENRPNGGGVIAFRAVWISGLFYLVAAALHSWALSGWSLQFSGAAMGKEIGDTLPWFGAMFAAVYAALYTRFSAQWSYLSGVYNQIMATQSQIESDGRDPNTLNKICLWKAGFAEDADDLHLATKRMFATAVRAVLEDERVAAAFDAHTKGGRTRRLRLLAQVRYAAQKGLTS